MGQKSSIDRLPENLRSKLIELLQNPAVTQKEIVELINAEAGENVVSKSSVNRYKLRMDKFATKTREAREVADAYIEKYGTESRNKLGKVVNEYIKLMVFDLTTELEELKDSDGEIKPEDLADIIYKVSRAIKELEQAEKLNAQREAEIKAAVQKEAAEKVETICKQKGVTTETKEAILAEIFSITENDNTGRDEQGSSPAVSEIMDSRQGSCESVGEIPPYRSLLCRGIELRNYCHDVKVSRRNELLLSFLLKGNDTAVHQRLCILGAHSRNRLLRYGGSRCQRRGQGHNGLQNPL